MNWNTTRWMAAVAVVGVVVAQAPDARAADSENDRRRRARAFIEEGNSKYDLGKYDEAIQLYEQAYEIWPHPETLFNLCQAHRQKKDLEAAVRYCKAFLRNEPSSEKYEQVEARIAEMEQAIADAKATVDKPPKDVASANESAGTKTAPAPAVVDEAPAPAAWYRDPLAWTLVGGGALLLGASTGLLVSSAGLQDDGDAALDADARDDFYARSQSRETWGWVAGGAGVAALAAGVVKLAIFEREGTGVATAWTFTPASGGGVAVVWGGTF